MEDGTLRVALAQVAPVLGEVAENARQVRDHIVRAKEMGADLVVFPELTLSGYSLGLARDDIALSVDDPELAGLAERADVLGCVVGVAEAGRVHTYNSAAYLERGVVRHVHRKLYLPTYDVWEERKHFTPGDAMRSFDTDIGRVAVLICSDAWQPALAVLAVQDGPVHLRCGLRLRPGRRRGLHQAERAAPALARAARTSNESARRRMKP